MKSKTSNGNFRWPRWRVTLFIFIVVGFVAVILVTADVRELTRFEMILIEILSTWAGIAVSLFLWQVPAAQGARDVLGRSSDKTEEFKASGDAPRLDTIQEMLKNEKMPTGRSGIEDWRDIAPDDVEDVIKQWQKEMTMAVQTKVIRGKIARVLNSREVALNVGDNKGVEVGMLFDVLSRGEDIVDPDTGESLGSLDLPKTRVKIVRVYDKLAVASTYRTKRVNANADKYPGLRFPPTIEEFFQPPKWETRYETIRAGGAFERDTADMSEDESFVKTGDPVVQVAGD